MHPARTQRQESLWVLRAQSGDRQALEHLLRGVQPSLRRYLRSLVGPTDADDIAQEVLVLVYRKLGWLESPEVFRPWVFRIASRAGFRHLRKTRTWRENEVDDMALDDLPASDSAPSTELLDRLSTMDGISPASRGVLVLHFQEEMSLPEIAAVLSIPLGTVKSRLAYGLAGLRKQLGNSRSSIP